MDYFDELKKKLTDLGIEGLDEKKINDVVEYSKKSVPKEFIPKTKYNETKEELDAAGEKLEETNKTIKDLQGKETDLEDYKNKLETLNTEYDTFKGESEKRVSNIKKKSLIKDELLKNGADPANVDLLMFEFNVDEMQLKDDKIIGVADYITPIKEKRKPLFIEKQLGGDPPKNPKGDGTDDEDLSKLTDEEYYNKLIKDKNE